MDIPRIVKTANIDAAAELLGVILVIWLRFFYFIIIYLIGKFHLSANF